MSFSFHIDPDAGMLHVVGEGPVTQADRLETMRSWLRHPDFRPGLDTLCDFSRAATPPTLVELRELVALIKQHADVIGRKRMAMIARTPIAFGAARQFGALCETGPIDVHVFADREAALTWLRPE